MPPTSPELKNIQAIVELQRQSRQQATSLEVFVSAVGAWAGSKSFIVLHVIWFALWIGANLVRAHPFDPFPYSLLTLIVSLEAIVLTSLILMAQNKDTLQADRRAHLDLQINLLAEQELTATLTVVSRIAERLGIDVAACDPRITQLLTPTSPQDLAVEIDRELAEVEKVRAS